MSNSRYIFGGTRLQARLGHRYSERDWQKFSSIRDLQHLIDTLVQGPAAHWVRGISADTDSGVIEAQLRQRLAADIDVISHWYPYEWQAAIQWTNALVWLDTLRGLQAAMHTGRFVRLMQTPFESLENQPEESRLNSLKDGPFAPLVPAVAAEEDLYPLWYQVWLRRLPQSARAYMPQLQDVVARFLSAYEQVTGLQADVATASAALGRRFHQHAFSPVGVFAFLGVQAIELIGLRQLLLDRLLFPAEVAA